MQNVVSKLNCCVYICRFDNQILRYRKESLYKNSFVLLSSSNSLFVKIESLLHSSYLKHVLEFLNLEIRFLKHQVSFLIVKTITCKRGINIPSPKYIIFNKIENSPSAWLASDAFLQTSLSTTHLLQNPLTPSFGALPSDPIF